MSTKDPHVALIDAHEKLQAISMSVKQAIALINAKMLRGETITADDQHMVQAIRQTAIEATKRVQDDLYEELKGHGLN